MAVACADARNRVRTSAGDIGRDRETLRAKQTAARRQHERRRARIDRTIEGKQDRGRWANFALGSAPCDAETRNSQQGCQRSQNAAVGDGRACAHWEYFEPAPVAIPGVLVS